MNESIRRMIDVLLTKYKINMTVVKCIDGIDLLKEIMMDQTNGNLIDLIILDENMEYMNGSFALEFLRGLELKNKLKVPYVASSTTEPFILQKLKELKYDKILPKPIDRNTLISLFKELKYI